MSTILLPLKAKHFKDKTFTHPCNCAIGSACKEKFNTSSVFEQVNEVDINGNTFKHSMYRSYTYWEDYETAAAHSFDDTIIRTIELIPV
jgi:hypothetical protein